MKYFLAQLDGQVIGDGVSIAPNATLIGNIYIGPKATIFPGVTISGPAYIGAGTTVGHNALVRDSMILNDCEIGFSTEVTRTYASDRCVLNGSNILDSVMAEGAVISNGSVTSNRPIDGSEVLVMLQGRRIRSGRGQIGTMIGPKAFLSSNVVTIPGVKVGAGAQVGPGMYVHEDVEDGQRILVKQEVQVVDDGE
jgi:bifunctional UDP-N-acetylglucosamine pyrophosphorylase/glucosamine-1-phosphate N-acetyltransferase